MDTNEVAAAMPAAGEDSRIKKKEREAFYAEVISQAVSLLDSSLPIISNLSNISSLLFNAFNDAERPINWAGFYIYDHGKEKLFLGPFQGRVACTVIPNGKGVCGTSVKEKATIVVDNVHNFPGHIACDSASESEIVIPIILNDIVYGVLDIDASIVCEFDNSDRAGLEAIVLALQKVLASSTPQDLLR